MKLKNWNINLYYKIFNLKDDVNLFYILKELLIKYNSFVEFKQRLNGFPFNDILEIRTFIDFDISKIVRDCYNDDKYFRSIIMYGDDKKNRINYDSIPNFVFIEPVDECFKQWVIHHDLPFPKNNKIPINNTKEVDYDGISYIDNDSNKKYTIPYIYVIGNKIISKTRIMTPNSILLKFKNGITIIINSNNLKFFPNKNYIEECNKYFNNWFSKFVKQQTLYLRLSKPNPISITIAEDNNIKFGLKDIEISNIKSMLALRIYEKEVNKSIINKLIPLSKLLKNIDEKTFFEQNIEIHKYIIFLSYNDGGLFFE